MKYRSEEDKSYGIAGMVVGLSVFDADDLYTGVSMDADGLECVQFTPEFFFTGNPRLSAKDSWQCQVSHYQVTMGLVIANTMCRKMVLDHGMVDRKMRKDLLKAVTEAGRELCSLDDDEVSTLFDKAFNYLVRVFSNNDVKVAIRDFAGKVAERRTLTSSEVSDLMGNLELR